MGTIVMFHFARNAQPSQSVQNVLIQGTLYVGMKKLTLACM